MNKENLETVNLIGHQLIDNLQQFGHEFVNGAMGTTIPIINTMTNNNLQTNLNVNNINHCINTKDNKLYICCFLPGITKETCKLNYSNNNLTIQAETNFIDEWNFIKPKKYKTNINVGLINKTNIKATFINGLLKIVIDKHIDDIESNINIE